MGGGDTRSRQKGGLLRNTDKYLTVNFDFKQTTTKRLQQGSVAELDPPGAAIFKAAPETIFWSVGDERLSVRKQKEKPCSCNKQKVTSNYKKN